ncbi:sugar transferase [Tabrizicola sp.]|uniref:sugar transferase n=1 Tax=Tabrizicola sp. TaxID=2005166 RepID=UPI003F2F2618
MPPVLQANPFAGTADGFVDDARHSAPNSAAGSYPADSVGGVGKRALDFGLALTALVLLMPLMLGVALMVKLTSRGPVFFGHERIGFAGRRFRCWKFRTMVVDGDRVLEEHFRRFPSERAVWLAERKLCNDPRITPLGAVLRKLSVDELPQLFNILMGQMSLVGPRPVVADELGNYQQSAGHYLRTRPGLTGLWQVSGRNDACYRKRVALDRVYVRRWSMLLDLSIMLKTVPAVLSSRGAR